MHKSRFDNEMMKKLILFAFALFALFNLSAQSYKVGDLYDVGGKRGVVFEASEDGKHGKIVSETQPAQKMTWYMAMKWNEELKDGWYLPSYEELLALLKVSEEVNCTLQKVGGKLPHFCWSTTEFDANCAWAVSVKTDSYGGSFKGNEFYVRAVSKF